MEFFRIRKDIPFMRHALVFNIISVVTFVLAVFFILHRGLHLSVEFTGGTQVELRYEQSADLSKIREALSKAGYTDFVVQNYGSSHDVLIRMPLKETEALSGEVSTETAGMTGMGMAASGDPTAMSGMAGVDGKPAQKESASSRLEKKIRQALEMDAPGATIQRIEYVGPQVGRELAENGALALLLVVVGIVIYLAFRFEWRFSVSAIIANLHDVIIIVGFFAFFQWEFSLSVLAAILAVLGYSVNESVVVFDRVRETFKKTRGMTTPQVLDHAITMTISRTIITHGATQMMVLSMLIFGGETLHYFAVALTIGICFGIYSSVLVASPLVMWLGVSREQFVKPKKEVENGGAVV